MHPVIQHLDGDSIRMSAGETVHLDVNVDATLDAGGLDTLDIYFTNSSPSNADLGIDTTSNVVLSNGVAVGSIISVRLPDTALVPIGVVAPRSDELSLSIDFNANATSALIGELLHALTYVNTSKDANLV